MTTPREAYHLLTHQLSVEPSLYDLAAPCVHTLAELRAVTGTSLRLALYYSRWLTRAALLLDDYSGIGYAELLDIYIMAMQWRDRLALVGENLIGVRPINIIDHYSTHVLPFMDSQQLQQLIDSPCIPECLKYNAHSLLGVTAPRNASPLATVTHDNIAIR